MEKQFIWHPFKRWFGCLERWRRWWFLCSAIKLGVDGFLPIPGVPTNLGLRDMIAALRWVAAHAAAFGGDPDNVTVFGESAGAMAIADLITSPLASDLFRPRCARLEGSEQRHLELRFCPLHFGLG